MPVAVKQIAKEVLDLSWMQKARDIKSKNYDDGNGEVMPTNVDKNFKGTIMCAGRKCTVNKTALKN